MEVKHQGSTLVMPEKRTSRKIPLNIFDRKASELHICVLFVYDNPGTSPNSGIILGLSKALSYYPQLAGHLSGGHIVIDDNSGVPVFETTVARKLEDFLPLEPCPSLCDLHPPPAASNPMLMVQLNRFECGGLVIGICASHWMADGQSMSNFFLSWSQLVRSPEMELEHPPVHDQEFFLVPRNPPVCSYPHERIEFSDAPLVGDNGDVNTMDNLIVNYSWEFISELKERASSATATRPAVLKPSTFACLLSHVWRKVSIARGLRDDEVTRLRLLVNGRPRLGIPSEYFGNLVLDAYPSTRVKELLKEGVGYGARLIKDAVARVDADYFQSFIDFGELNKNKELVASQDVEDNFVIPNLEVDSWLGFQFHEVDMGSGAPCAFMPSWIPMEGLVIFVPAASHGALKGGINVIVTLFKEHAKIFKQIAHSID
ncbi:tryptamine hydroxycinnamoyltransferase 2-like [Nymphaea colorata]|nr:tryptamine hydroxycinnamoyltransferase 2-like [Nymphaea colorata]